MKSLPACKFTLLQFICNVGTNLNLHTLQELEIHEEEKVRIIEIIASQWRDIATYLAFEQDIIDSIANTCLESHDACYEILAIWLKGDECLKGPVTWQTFIQCLLDIGQVELADKLNTILL